MEELNKEIKNRKFLVFIAVTGIVLVAVIFIIFLYSFNKNAKKISNQAVPNMEKKSAFDSLSAPVADSSGKSTSENYLQYLSNSIPVISPPSAGTGKSKKSSNAKITETSKDYIDYLPAPTK